ncbi:calcineurin-like phosphoesterase [Metarhizium robertsii]|uniref:Ser/Thr protein phosphatase family n=2 Tax=Metarhizium robertsii TaxID=568076 RepID=E9EZG5_METRA|nr:Ser/Thr protein phosphatase family [Metarhizium robertsii ARSEF 23]EFY99356.1 Ser/Thr protein phosphatase family [Metarhizium robertsii ARSEF 23]EXV04612.1 calcineurin-like phosphoesterase [Metarhizium robertsii]
MTAAAETSEIYPISAFIHDLPVTLSTTLAREAGAAAASPPGSISARRLIIIGDVHGLRKSLEALLTAVGFDKSQGDEVIFVGDLVNKGPDSGAVIDFAARIGARGVRGNHDDAVLRAAQRLKMGPAGDDDDDGEDGNQKDKKRRSVSARTAAALSASQLDYLAALPLLLRVTVTPSLPGIGEIVVAHAGLVPRVPLEEQPAHAVMHMRSLRAAEGGALVPMEEAGEQGWIAEWDAWQDECAGNVKTMVVFGHDAKRRLQRGRYALGLDTACVYGGKLSAWVVGAGEARVVQVDCADEVDEVRGS